MGVTVRLPMPIVSGFQATSYKADFLRHTSKIHGLGAKAYDVQHGGVPFKVTHMECHICNEVILHDRVDIVKHLRTKRLHHPGANKNYASKSESTILKWYHQKFVRGVKRADRVKPWTYKKMKPDAFPQKSVGNGERSTGPFGFGVKNLEMSDVGSNVGLTPGQEAQLEQIYLTLDHIPGPSGRKTIAKRLKIRPSRLHIIDTWFINRQAQHRSRLAPHRMEIGLYTKPKKPRNEKKTKKPETEGSRKSSRRNEKSGNNQLKTDNEITISQSETVRIDN